MHPLRLLPSLFILSIALIATPIAPCTAAPASTAPSASVLVDDPAVMGEWGEVMPWPDKAVHAVLLHTGRNAWPMASDSDEISGSGRSGSVLTPRAARGAHA